MNTFTLELKKYMLDNNISQNDIALKCGLSKQAVSNLFNRDNISLDKMKMLANACECDVCFTFVPHKTNTTT